MRNIILAGATGLVLALSGTAAFAIPTTAEIMSHGQVSDQSAVGAFLPFPAMVGSSDAYAPSAQYDDHGHGANTGAGVGGTGSHR
jgi:hypothetical protein